MTREEAIAHGKEQLDVFGDEHAEFIKLALKALEQESRWIPCSEKLPNDRREVLVTAYWHELQEISYAKRLDRKKLIALTERMENDL